MPTTTTTTTANIINNVPTTIARRRVEQKKNIKTNKQKKEREVKNSRSQKLPSFSAHNKQKQTTNAHSSNSNSNSNSNKNDNNNCNNNNIGSETKTVASAECEKFVPMTAGVQREIPKTKREFYWRRNRAQLSPQRSHRRLDRKILHTRTRRLYVGCFAIAFWLLIFLLYSFLYAYYCAFFCFWFSEGNLRFSHHFSFLKTMHQTVEILNFKPIPISSSSF